MTSTTQTSNSSKEDLYAQGLKCCTAGEFTEAIAAFNKVLAIEPKFCPAWNNQGNALSALKQYGNALAAYDRAVALNPQYHQAWFNRGLLFQEMGAYGNAQECYERAIAISPDPIYLHAKTGLTVNKKLY